ncbi:MAG: response regulator transcription factor [Rhodothermales bacterium]
MPIRVGLAEDNPTVRRRVEERLCFFDEVHLTLVAESGDHFMERLATCSPDQRPEVVLMDIEMPGRSGVETTALLKQQYPDIEVTMFTVFEDEEQIFASVQAGASGYLLKEATASQIVAAVQDLMAGGAPMSPAIARKVMQHVRHTSVASPSYTFDLSDRELQILEGIVADETEHQIGERLFISPHTVRSHIKRIYKKLHVHSRASAVRVALQHRLVS